MRLDEPVKELRRRSVGEGETDESNRTAGASGVPQHAPKRPGRTASLHGTAHRTRSQKWRSPQKGGQTMRRGVLAQGSRTGTKTRSH